MRTILFDKSALQALSLDEMTRLGKRAQVLATEALVLELVADIRYGDERSKQLAKKLRFAGAVVNAEYDGLCVAELYGKRVPMTRRPLLVGDEVVGRGGEIGVVARETYSDEILARCAAGKPSEEDAELARTWTEAMRQFDIGSLERDFRKAIPRSRYPKSLEESLELVDALLADASKQAAHLEMLLTLLPKYKSSHQEVTEIWTLDPSKVLRSMAPYSMHCLRVSLALVLAVATGLIGTRDTNFVDAHYLHYLPFASEFASRDADQRRLCVPLLGPGQVLVSPEELKTELSAGT